MAYNIPILYLAFNRPVATERSFGIIQQLKPQQLYIAQDGPRTKNEMQLTNKVQEIIKRIDWSGNVKYLIREKNIGCRNAVNEALDWFFDQVEMGVIIEDDIVPDLSFFYFAEQLLHKYKDDTRVMLISGNNLLNKHPGIGDYFFSKIGAIWGWASWRRVWKLHDKEMKLWKKIKQDTVANQILPLEHWQERIKNMEDVLKNNIDTWDYPFTITRLINSGLSILPRVNLIENIGFHGDATHTKTKPLYFHNKKHFINGKSLEHPLVIAPDEDFDKKIFESRNQRLRVWDKIKAKFV